MGAAFRLLWLPFRSSIAEAIGAGMVQLGGSWREAEGDAKAQRGRVSGMRQAANGKR
jgi:hypothetical protein